MRLFDDLAGGADTDAIDERDWRHPVNRELLEAAAVLHDVGYLINYSKHHKHSLHLIMHSDMPGYTSRQREIVANVARYHRRSRPKPDHAPFARLGEADQEIVRRLSAILRIADGMDRTHTQSVQDARVIVDENTAAFQILLDHPSAPDARRNAAPVAGDPASPSSSPRGARPGDNTPPSPTCITDTEEVNLWGARRKAGLFEDVFGLDARFEIAPLESAAGAQ